MRTLHDLELIRHTESLRSGKRHAIGSSPGIVGTAHGFEFLGSGLQDRPFRRGRAHFHRARPRVRPPPPTLKSYTPERSGFPLAVRGTSFFRSPAAATLSATGVVPATFTVTVRVNN